MTVTERLDHPLDDLDDLAERQGATPPTATITTTITTTVAVTGSVIVAAVVFAVALALSIGPEMSPSDARASLGTERAETGFIGLVDRRTTSLTGSAPPVAAAERIATGSGAVADWARSVIAIDPEATLTGIVEHRHPPATLIIGFTTPTAPAELVDRYAWALGLEGYTETARFDSGSHGPPTALVTFERQLATVMIALAWDDGPTEVVITVGETPGDSSNDGVR